MNKIVLYIIFLYFINNCIVNIKIVYAILFYFYIFVQVSNNILLIV